MIKKIYQFMSATALIACTPIGFAGDFKTLDFLNEISGTKTLSGQQNDRKPEDGAQSPSHYSDKIFNITGKYPALWGGDFEFDSPRVETRQDMIDEAKRQWDKGAVISLMWHACPPTVSVPCSWGNDVQSKLSNAQWNDLVTDGGYLNGVWKSRMDTIADYLQQLEDHNVEVLWRPLHEMNQGAFWWAGRPGSGGTAQLYRLTHDYLTHEKGLSNLIWVWDMQDFSTLGNTINDYNPGSAYWDVAALDIYEGFSTWKYNLMVDVAGEKPIAIGENWDLPSPDRLASENKWTFFMGWAKGVFERNSDDYIRSVYNANNVITLDEMPGWNGTTPEPDDNLAFGKTAKASSEEDSSLSAKFAFDNNLATRWGSLYSDNQWLYVDLEKAYDIEAIELRWEEAFAKSYKIQVSSDTITWTDIYSTQSGDGGADTFNITSANASGRYVRMLGLERGTQWGYSLYEMKVKGKVSDELPTPSTNLALGKAASSSSNEAANYDASNAFDAKGSTRWASLEGSDNEWLAVDLGKAYEVNSIELQWEAAYAQAYQLQISSDNSQWSTIYNTTNGGGAEDKIMNLQATGRYVRMQGIKRGTQWGYSIIEMRVLGREGPSEPTQPTGTPYLGVPINVPGVIEAEYFDIDGYLDTTTENEGGALRNSGVDIEVNSKGGHNIGWIRVGEWLEYSINVAETDTYTLQADVAAEIAGGKFDVTIDGQAITSFMVPSTGGWYSWTTLDRNIQLTVGTHLLRLSIASGSFNLDRLKVIKGADQGGELQCQSDSEWKQADLTNFESYPDPGSEECTQYNGCKWSGYFAGVEGKQTEAWVQNHNILAVHSKHFEQYKLKDLLLRQGDKEIIAKVYDMCADSDCEGCCTANMASTGFLIDVEKYTMQRLGTGDGMVEWKVCN